MTVETLTALNVDVHYRQVIAPKHESGSFLGDDTDNHDFIFSGKGKSVLNFSLDNAPDQALTWTLYGMHESDGDVGDVGTFQVDTDSVTAASKAEEAVVGLSFPFYLLRLAFAVSPTDTPKKNVSVYVDLAVGI
jgi:hypothetical protein